MRDEKKIYVKIETMNVRWKKIYVKIETMNERWEKNLRKNWNYEWEMRKKIYVKLKLWMREERTMSNDSCSLKQDVGFPSELWDILDIMPGTNSYIYCGDPNGSLDNRSNPIKVQHQIALRNITNMSILISYRCPLSRPPSRKYMNIK